MLPPLPPTLLPAIRFTLGPSKRRSSDRSMVSDAPREVVPVPISTLPSTPVAPSPAYSSTLPPSSPAPATSETFPPMPRGVSASPPMKAISAPDEPEPCPARMVMSPAVALTEPSPLCNMIAPVAELIDEPVVSVIGPDP